MFEQAFVDIEPAPRGALALSSFVQVCVVGALLLIPLLYTQGLPGVQLRSVLAAPPPPPAPPQRILVKTQARSSDGRVFSAPALVVSRTTTTLAESLAPPEVGLSAWPGGVYEGPGVAPGNIAPPAPLPAKTQSHQPIRIGGGVSEANLIRRVQPVYPHLARTTHVEGVVEFTAIISKQGTIENLQLVHGHPLLVNAAREAILQWRYRPTLLNGEPVEVITDIMVKFTLSQ
jgi:periplasmic protein TonB